MVYTIFYKNIKKEQILGTGNSGWDIIILLAYFCYISSYVLINHNIIFLNIFLILFYCIDLIIIFFLFNSSNNCSVL